MRAYVTPTETPIHDRLVDITNGWTLATFHGQRGGEWDTQRGTPLRKRRRLTGAGWMTLHGASPDRFADMLRGHVSGAELGPDPIAWFIREALRALDEVQAARQRDTKRRIAKAAGVKSYYEYRVRAAKAAGFESLWHYRQARGWKEDRRR